MEGSVIIHEKLLEWEWADVPEMMALWLHLLLRANSRDKSWHGVLIPRGSFITSRAELAAKVGLSEKQVRTGLERLKTTNEISLKTTNRYTIVTICKYDIYQFIENEEGPTKGQPEGQQRATTIVCTSNILDNNIIPGEDNNTASTLVGPTNREKKPEYDYDRITSAWNATCKSLSKVRVLSESRKSKLRLRLQEIGKAYPDRDLYDVLQELFDKIEASGFLTGRVKPWKANFVWIFENDYRWIRVMEGNYDNGGERVTPTRYRQPDINSVWD